MMPEFISANCNSSAKSFIYVLPLAKNENNGPFEINSIIE
jgi:hypothetical protein